MVHVTRKNSGYSLVEILISVGVFSAIVSAVVGIFIVSRESVEVGRTKMRATHYIGDYFEKIKNIRRNDWTVLVDGRYSITTTGNTLALQTTAAGETVNGFTRYLDISGVSRDASGNIVSSGGTDDPSSKKITVTISWAGIKPGTISQSAYITRYQDNLAWVQTTEDDFNDNGTHSGTVAVNNAGGEVVLGAGGNADWCEPILTLEQLDLPKNGVAKALTAIEGKAFAGTGENSSGESFVDITIDDTPNATFHPTNDVYNGYKTNDVFGEENYGYIVTDTNSSELVILNIATNPISQIGTFNVSGSTDADSVYVSGNTAYITQGNKLWNINVTDKSNPSTSGRDADGVTLSGTGKAVYVVGNYAYIAVDSGSKELQIVDISNPNNLTLAGSLDVDPINSGEYGEDVVVNQTGTRAYLAARATSGKEFYIVDTTNKSNPSVLGSYEANGMNPRGVEVVPGGRAILVGTGGEEYQVINISTESNPVRCGGMNLSFDIFDSASVIELSDNDAYTYIVTGDASSEFKIIEGGPGGQFAVSGTWESETFDAGHSTSFNRLDVTFDEPVQTSVKFQVAIVDPGGSGTCTDADFSNSNFVDPQGHSASWFFDDGALPIDNTGVGYENPGQCMRLRTYLETSEQANSPTWYDVSVNYSP